MPDDQQQLQHRPRSPPQLVMPDDQQQLQQQQQHRPQSPPQLVMPDDQQQLQHRPRSPPQLVMPDDLQQQNVPNINAPDDDMMDFLIGRQQQQQYLHPSQVPLSASHRHYRRPSLGTRSDRGAELWGSLGTQGTLAAPRMMSPYPTRSDRGAQLWGSSIMPDDLQQQNVPIINAPDDDIIGRQQQQQYLHPSQVPLSASHRHFRRASSGTRSDRGAELWGYLRTQVSPSASHQQPHSLSLLSTAGSSSNPNLSLSSSDSHPPGKGRFRRASSCTRSDRGAELWGSLRTRASRGHLQLLGG